MPLSLRARVARRAPAALALPPAVRREGRALVPGPLGIISPFPMCRPWPELWGGRGEEADRKSVV